MKKTTIIQASFVSIIISVINLNGQSIKNNLDNLVDQAISTSLICLERSVDEIGDRSKYPSYGNKDLEWLTTQSEGWTSGFYPGCLWYAYELSKDSKYKKWAQEWTAGLEKQKFNTVTHDLGFMIGSSFGNGLRLAPDDAVTAPYKEILLTAAKTADSRFFPVKGVYPSSWDANKLPNSVPVVIDIMMDLELMMWASQNGGDPAMMDRCISHIAATYNDFIREDGGSFHIVRYDKTNGKVLSKGQLQGDVDSSTWSRGHAWMVYGLVSAYRYTKDTQYLTQAIVVADYFIKHLPKDRIANWDFQSSLDHRDASASAIVCSALLELQGYMTKARLKKYYLKEAENILSSLCQPPYSSNCEGTNCILLRSTHYYHGSSNTDVPCSFADYYFLESLVRYKELQKKNGQ